MKLIIIIAIAASIAILGLVIFCIARKIKKDSSCFVPDFSSMKFSKSKCDCV